MFLFIILILYLVYRYLKSPSTNVKSPLLSCIINKNIGKFECVDRTFIQGLTPLPLKQNCFTRITFRPFYVNNPKSVITVYQEGILLRVYGKYYFCEFASCKLEVAKNYTLSHDSDIFYYICREEKLQENYEKLLAGDYYYSYEKVLISDRSGVNADTRHYTKSGRLDKRYSKQNKNTGGTYRSREYSATEGFYDADGFVLSVDEGNIQFKIDDKHEFLTLINIVYTKAGMPIPSFDEMPSYEDMYRFKNINVVPLLKEEDRIKIKKYLNTLKSDKSGDEIVISEEELDKIVKEGNHTRIVNGLKEKMTREEIRDFEIKKRNLENKCLNLISATLFEGITKDRQKELGYSDDSDIDDMDDDD